jgi:hypothetical protein
MACAIDSTGNGGPVEISQVLAIPLLAPVMITTLPALFGVAMFRTPRMK